MTLLVLALILSAAPEAVRPPAREHAPAEFFSHLEGGTDTPGARFLQTLSPAAQEKVKTEGHVVLDQKSTHGGPALIRAVVRFDRPRDEVYALIIRPAEQSAFLPHVTQSKPFGVRTADGEIDDYVVSFLFTFRYRTQHWFYPEAHRVEWSLDPSGEDSLAEQQGFWQLYELDEKTTLAEYGTRLVMRGAFINFLRGLGERGGITEALVAFRKHVHGAKLEGQPSGVSANK